MRTPRDFGNGRPTRIKPFPGVLVGRGAARLDGRHRAVRCYTHRARFGVVRVTRNPVHGFSTWSAGEDPERSESQLREAGFR